MPPYDLVGSLRKEHIFLGVDAADKDRLLEAIAGLVAEHHPSFAVDVVLRKLQDREKVMSTGIGNRIAVPHVTLDDLDLSRCFLFVLGREVDFQAIDGRPVRVVFLLVVRPDDIAFHLQGLATIARLARHPGLADEICRSATREEVLERLLEREPSAAGKK